MPLVVSYGLMKMYIAGFFFNPTRANFRTPPWNSQHHLWKYELLMLHGDWWRAVRAKRQVRCVSRGSKRSPELLLEQYGQLVRLRPAMLIRALRASGSMLSSCCLGARCRSFEKAEARDSRQQGIGLKRESNENLSKQTNFVTMYQPRFD